MAMHGLFIGIDRYQDTRIPELRYACNDARALYRVFADSVECSASLLLEENATARAVKQAVMRIASEADESDSVVLFFSGHGVTERIEDHSGSVDIIPLLIPYDADKDYLEATALSMDNDVARFFRRLRAENVVFFIDSCYSGRAGGRTFPVGSTSFLRGIEPGLPQLDRITGRGRLIVTAANSEELAYEHDTLQHGIFSYYLLDGLKGTDASVKKGYTTFEELYGHLAEHVPEKASELFRDGKQHPVLKGKVEEEIKFPLLRGIKTLLDFPQAFHPLTVVVGDRRESEPRSAGDLFAYSASPSDLTWILHLGLPRDTDIVSDKVFVVAEKEYLIERFGQGNLLVIGSPASNLLSRVVNSTALFRFLVSRETQEAATQISTTIQSIKNEPLEIRRFALDPRNQEDLRFYMNQFRKAGFADPTKPRGITGFHIPPDKDYGVITLCRNPYAPPDSSGFVCILAAGVHLPGTMQAVKYLGKPDTYFRERPLGGVLSVTLLIQQWEERVTQSTSEWSTEPYYSSEKLVESFLRLRRTEGRSPEVTESEIDACISFIQQLGVSGL